MTDADQKMTPPTNLAIAYAPINVRSAFSLLLQIDQRFANILRNAREPMIAQIKMAWWREAFGKAPHQRPRGEPLLQALNQTGELIPYTALEALVLGWEMLLEAEQWNQEMIDGHASLRAQAVFLTYGQWVGSTQDVLPVGQLWAINSLRSDFPERVSDSIAARHASISRTRALRPLSILAMSMRTASGPRLVWHALTGF